MFRRFALLFSVLFLASTGVAHAAGRFVPRLPAPTGPHAVGVTDLHLADPVLPDPGSPTGTREVMVSVFYPAADIHGYPVAPQMTRQAAAWFATTDTVFLHPELSSTKDKVDWAATLTHAHTGAPARPGRHPVLLYSPGFGDPRTLGTGLAEELASRGFVVVTLDHPGETSIVEFPGGRTRDIRELNGRDPGTDPTAFRAMIATRLADTRLVLDNLEILATGGNPDAEHRALPENLGSSLDPRRIGMYGHSAGGTTAAEALHEDRRIDAAVNLEGFLDYLPDRPGRTGEPLPVVRDGVDRPLLLWGTDGYRTERYDRAWSAMLARSPEWTCRRQLGNATHWVFTDFGAMAPQLEAAGLMTGAQRKSLIGAIGPAVSVPAVRDGVRSFFARNLRR
ncbi:alpha/beta hydrolase family protein [Amycolatopsis sp. NPDC059021]|uniref:alpha/beta hydrolase family protein n=1 Tax=Amycolatopsis sp. NPDC059021 TaxID=3346704 RepID=UPI00366E073B